jgi:hypothetical protein
VVNFILRLLEVSSFSLLNDEIGASGSVPLHEAFTDKDAQPYLLTVKGAYSIERSRWAGSEITS